MAKTQILDLLRKGDFAAAHTELAELGSECVLNPGGMTPREKTSQLLRELGVRGGLLIDPKFRLNLVMVAGKDGERCNVRCPHLQAGPKQSYCTLFGQYIEKLILLGHVRHESCSNDPDVKACESYSLGRLQVVETFNAALSEQIKREAAEQWIKYSRAEEKRHNGR